MYYSAAQGGWQLLEEQIDEDYTGDPGVDRTAWQVWGARYIDDAVMRIVEGDGAYYHITDHQFSSIGMIESGSARLLETVRYDAYGKATHRWPHDFDDNGYATIGWGEDLYQLYLLSLGPTTMSSGSYDVRMDLNRDGVIDDDDYGEWMNLGIRGPAPDGDITGRAYNAIDNVIGYCGYVFAPESKRYCVRFRWLDPVTGRWMTRDPAGYVDGMSLFEYVQSSPVMSVDPLGLETCLKSEEGDTRITSGSQATTRWLNDLNPDEIDNILSGLDDLVRLYSAYNKVSGKLLVWNVKTGKHICKGILKTHDAFEELSLSALSKILRKSWVATAPRRHCGRILMSKSASAPSGSLGEKGVSGSA